MKESWVRGDRMKGQKGMVSVLIPCYNHERFVGDCLGSILDQVYTSYEVLLCDDCSKDGSVSVVRELMPLFEEKGIRFVLLLNHQNQGITRNLNRMLRESRGEFIKILASDDMLTRDYLAEMTGRLNDSPSLQFLFSNGYKVREAAGYPVAREQLLEPMVSGSPDCEGDIFNRIYSHNFVPAPTLLFRKSVFEEVGEYDEEIAIEDLEMLLRVLKRYPQGMGYCEKKLVYYRINDNSITSMTSNAGAVRRIKFMHDNSVAIARKYRHQVTPRLYRRRMWELRREYVLKRLIVFVKGLKR